jgi:hypothetical protein
MATAIIAIVGSLLTDAHARLRQKDPAAEEKAAEADRDRRDLIGLFKDDLHIPRDEEDDDHAAGQTRADVLA